MADFWDIVGEPGTPEDANVGDIVCVETEHDGKIIDRSFVVIEHKSVNANGTVSVGIRHAKDFEIATAINPLVIRTPNTSAEAGSE